MFNNGKISVIHFVMSKLNKSDKTSILMLMKYFMVEMCLDAEFFLTSFIELFCTQNTLI